LLKEKLEGKKTLGTVFRVGRMVFGQRWEVGVWSEMGGWGLVRDGRMVFGHRWEVGVWSEMGG
jgi:hypothetical protein